MSDSPVDNDAGDRPVRKDTGDRPVRNDYASVSLALAVVALVTNLFAPSVGIGLGAAAMVFGLLGVRVAVRLDFGMPRALFGLGFGLVALFLGAIVVGGQNGGQFSGLAPAPSPMSGPAAVSLR